MESWNNSCPLQRKLVVHRTLKFVMPEQEAEYLACKSGDRYLRILIDLRNSLAVHTKCKRQPFLDWHQVDKWYWEAVNKEGVDL